ncbi:MAG: DNA-directed RNA polymerase subunit beta [Chloroflexota bacterium]|nr:MAG: DNA-directed RNA polymerase subunit beta [Chloroflexota bacterium]
MATPRQSFARISEVLPIPNLIDIQLQSFQWFVDEGLRELLTEISPITDFTGKNLELHFEDYTFGTPKFSELECRERDITYSMPLRVRTRLIAKETGEIKEMEIFMGDFPRMTEKGTFIINGAERVVVSQLVRSPGVYFTHETDATTGRQLCYAKLIPNRGAWLEFETSNKDVISVKVDRKRKIPVTTLLRAIGYTSDEQIMALFTGVDTADHRFIQETIAKDPTKDADAALLEFYRRLRPGDPPTTENARNLLNALFFNARRYDLGKVGRYKVNRRLVGGQEQLRVLTKEDLVKIIEMMIRLNNGIGQPDDIDHLGNRRIRAVGELIQNAFRVGLLRMERVVKERMSIQDPESATPAALINIRPIVAAMKEFFGGSQLSQFMDQTNPLAELTHKRRLSALGPGGLNRERAGMEVRDVHHSHYGRICPIETPEGPNIGLIGSLATYGRINDYGFVETPYRRVYGGVRNVEAGFDIEGFERQQRREDKLQATRYLSFTTQSAWLIGKTLAQRVVHPKTSNTVLESGVTLDAKAVKALVASGADYARIQPVVSRDIVYLPADEEDRYVIAQANAGLDDEGHFAVDRVEARHGEEVALERLERIELMDVSPKQLVSVAAALIPFLEHDDANRALMGSNMQRQAVPLIRPQAPIVGTGMEARTARDSGQVLLSRTDGEVLSVTANAITVLDQDGKVHPYPLTKFVRSNQGTCINQRPIVARGTRVKIGQPLVDSMSTQGGELALGQNLVVAFMSWEGYNFEDAIIISQSLVREDRFTSIHIEKHEIEARDTKLGPEEITRDLPNVGDDTLRDLDERGIIRVGAEVGPGDILVGKITPKGETELTAEERLLRAIFGEKAREVKDTSLRVPHGERGKVVDVKVFSRDSHDELPAGVNQLVRVSIAQKRKISEGDKMAGRHGNKGVIARILPVEDMPFLPDGSPVEIILNPIGVPSRMNVGQILETHLGWAAQALGIRVTTPVFDGAIEDEIQAMLDQAGFDRDGKTILRDGRTGEPFDQRVTVGNIYMLKLIHLVEDKIHARSTGPYSLITQQPLGGKAQFGGQRFGEMEVWALEAYGAAHILQEILTVKSDDVVGRVKTYEAIVKGEDIMEPGVPESFKVLVKELQSLGLAVEVLNEDEEAIEFRDDGTGLDDEVPRLGVDLSRHELSD